MTRQRSQASAEFDENDPDGGDGLGVNPNASPYNSAAEDSDSDSEDSPDPDSIIPVLAGQIRLYEKRSSDDDLECMFESVNLSDADGMFSFLLKKSVQEGHHEQLMRILACLAVIPRSSYVLLFFSSFFFCFFSFLFCCLSHVHVSFGDQ